MKKWKSYEKRCLNILVQTSWKTSSPKLRMHMKVNSETFENYHHFLLFGDIQILIQGTKWKHGQLNPIPILWVVRSRAWCKKSNVKLLEFVFRVKSKLMAVIGVSGLSNVWWKDFKNCKNWCLHKKVSYKLKASHWDVEGRGQACRYGERWVWISR